MVYKIKKIANCEGPGAAEIGHVCDSYSDINKAFKFVEAINGHTAYDKHSGPKELCKCEYAVFEE